MLEAVEDRFCSLEVLELLEVMRCVLLCIPEAVEGRLCLLEALEALEVPKVLKVMRRVLLCMLEGVEVSKFVGGDAPCATP